MSDALIVIETGRGAFTLPTDTAGRLARALNANQAERIYDQEADYIPPADRLAVWVATSEQFEQSEELEHADDC